MIKSPNYVNFRCDIICRMHFSHVIGPIRPIWGHSGPLCHVVVVVVVVVVDIDFTLHAARRLF